MSCPSAGLCVAGDFNGNIWWSTSPSTAVSWHSTPVDAGNIVSSVACPSSSLCLAEDPSGLLSSSNPEAASPTWASTGVTTPFNALSCPPGGDCFGISAGDIYFSSAPTSSAAWTAQTIDSTNPLSSISCASDSLCAAGDQGGNAYASTTPTGAASSWRLVVTAAFSVRAVACTATPALCVAGDELGDIWSSTSPAGGSSAWTSASQVAGYDPVTDASCVGANLCAVVEGGQVSVAAEPGSSAPAWTSTNLEPTSDLHPGSTPSRCERHHMGRPV